MLGRLPTCSNHRRDLAHDPGMDLEIARQLILFHPLSAQQAVQDDHTQTYYGHLRVM